MAKIVEGGKAPEFELETAEGTIRSADFAGRAYVVYFYPKDDTSGCTVEACKFRDDFEKFQAVGAEVIGISDDSEHSHGAFVSKYKLPFTLLSDKGGSVRKLYGVKKTFGVIPGRATFVIDRAGVVRHTFSSQSKPAQHVAEALKALASLS